MGLDPWVTKVERGACNDGAVPEANRIFIIQCFQLMLLLGIIECPSPHLSPVSSLLLDYRIVTEGLEDQN
jgi:hypothetical protein